MKSQDIRFGYGHPLFNGQFPQGVVDRRNIDGVRTLNRTRVASHTNPDAGALRRLFLQTLLHQSYCTVGRIIDCRNKGASTGTTLAMPARVKIHAGAALHPVGKTRISPADID
jgi:hypothetical protein